MKMLTDDAQRMTDDGKRSLPPRGLSGELEITCGEWHQILHVWEMFSVPKFQTIKKTAIAAMHGPHILVRRGNSAGLCR